MKIRGEYWIEASGHIEFADGSMGVDVPDHPLLAAREIERTICDALAIEYWDQEDADAEESFEGHVLTEMADEWEIDPDEVHLRAELKSRRPDLLVAYDAAKHDPREYVMRELGWIRVHGNTVQTFRFDEEARKRIADGIGEILFEEGGVEEASDKTGKTVEELVNEFELCISGLDDQKSFYATVAEVESGDRLGTEVPTAEAAQKIADQKLAESDRAIEHPYYAQAEARRTQRGALPDPDAAQTYLPSQDGGAGEKTPLSI